MNRSETNPLNKLDNIIETTLSKKIQQPVADTTQKQITLEEVIRLALKSHINEQLLTPREVKAKDSLETILSRPRSPGQPIGPDLNIFPTYMKSGGINGYTVKSYNDIQALIEKQALNAWPPSQKNIENIFKSLIKSDSFDKYGPEIPGRVATASDRSYEWQVPVYATDLKSGTLFLFNKDGSCHTWPDLNTSTKFNWKLNGTKIEISNPGGSKFGYIHKKGNNLVFELTEEVKSGEFDEYKESGFIKRFFLVAGHGAGTQGLYQRTPSMSFDDFKNSRLKQIGDVIHTIFDWAGLIPGYGDIIDLVNAIWYYAQDRYLEACLSLIAVIPWAGTAISLTLKRTLATIRYGSKGGLEALQSAMKSEQKFMELWKKNVRQRGAVKEFFKKLIAFNKRIDAAGGLKKVLLQIVKNIGSIPNMKLQSQMLKFIVKKWGDDFAKYLKQTAQFGDNAVKIAEEGADELFLATSAKIFSKEGKQYVIQAMSKAFVTAAKSPGLLRNVTNRMFAMLPKKVWDAIASNMVNGFIKLAKKDPHVFVATILNTPQGKAVLQKIFIDNKKTIIEWVKKADFKIGDFALAKTKYAFGQAVTDEQIWKEIMSIITRSGDDAGETLYKNLIVPFFNTTKTIDGTVVGGLAVNKWIDEIIVDAVNKGNIVFIEFTKSFWNRLYAYMPQAIYKTYDTGYIGIKKILRIKYDWRGGSSILDPVTKAVSEYLTKNPSAWTGDIYKTLNTILYYISRTFGNIKRLDIVYNEFQDLLEKLGIYDESATHDQRQGVVVSLLTLGFQSASGTRVSNLYKEYIKPGVENTEKVLVQAPGVPVHQSNPEDYEFVTKDKKTKKNKVQFQTPTKTGVTPK